MSYPPAINTHSPQNPAEVFELQSPVTTSHQPIAGPSRPKHRTLTIHPSASTSAFLFPDGGNQPQQSPRRRRSSTLQSHRAPKRSNRAHFLQDERDTEDIRVPDIGHMLGIDDTTEDHFAIANGMRSIWKKRLYLLMEEPGSGREAFTVHVLVTGAIIFSAILTTLSTLPSFHTDPAASKTLFGLDTTLVVLFTIEYITRSLAHSDSFSQYYTWATSFFGLLDLIAILPYYIEVARNDDTSILFRFSILRTFRLFRVFRAFKYQSQLLLTIEVMFVAVRRSKDALVALSFFILLVLVFFSTLIYFAERGTWDANIGAFLDADGDPSLFDSIPQTAWFALVTMSTVGYGDVVPRSMLGKLLTVPLLMFGLLLIALPSFVLGRNFAIVFDAMTSQARAPKMFSTDVTPRTSLDAGSTTIPQTSEEPVSADNAPLLPISTDHMGAISMKRGGSPMPGGTSNGSRDRPVPKMWDGAADGVSDRKSEKDLTNTKLAKNQLVLLEQIDGLRQTIDRQGEMLDRLMGLLGQDALNGHVRSTRSGEKGKTAQNEEQFTLGSDDEDK